MGKKTLSGEFTVTIEADPKLSVGDLIWLEEKEDGLLRPSIRTRFRVKSRAELDGAVRYEFDRLGITPALP